MLQLVTKDYVFFWYGILEVFVGGTHPSGRNRVRQTKTTQFLVPSANCLLATRRLLIYSPKPAPSSKSPEMSPSSAVASWYCWYSEMRSFKFDSASVNSISSIPSPVYQ